MWLQNAIIVAMATKNISMGFQFAHIDWVGKTTSFKRSSTGSHGTQRASGWSAKDILAEAQRLKGHCQHVPFPKPPALIYGVPLMEVEVIADTWAATRTVDVKLKSGKIAKRKMRSDAPIMACGVISFPADRIDEWPAYRDHAIEQLKQKHGDRLVSAVEHLDEAHPHLHFYLVPLVGESFGAVHDGYAASRAARAAPGNKIRDAFQSAMRLWQDWVQEKIGLKFGLARIGPRRQRLKNAQWKESEVARSLDQRQKRADEEQIRIDKAVADIALREEVAIKKRNESDLAYIERTTILAKKIGSANEVDARLEKLQADLDRRDVLIAKKQQSLDMTHIERTTILAKKIGGVNKTQIELDRLIAENAMTRNELIELRANNKNLADDLNVAQNENSSLKKKLKKAGLE